MASRQGLAFTAWLGCKEPGNPRTVLIEINADGSLNVTRTGGDAWSVDAGGGAAAAAGVVQTCNKWDAKGRNPAMNVYIDIDIFRCSSATPPEAPSSNGGGSGEAGSSSSGGEEDDERDGPSRCKLGHLIQHCLPQLAAQLGGYSQLALCRCTWVADEASGRPLPGSILTVGRQDPSHWRLLRQLAKQKETGAGVRSGSPPPPDEEAALKRAKETLLEAAAHFGPAVAAKCRSLTVRKLYLREYHFFSPTGEDVADSRRRALEWAAGLAAVNDMLERCPEVRAKLSERLTGPGAGGGSRPRKRPRQQGASGGGSGRRVVLAVGPAAAASLRTAGAARPGAAAAAAAAAGGALDAQHLGLSGLLPLNPTALPPLALPPGPPLLREPEQPVAELPHGQPPEPAGHAQPSGQSAAERQPAGSGLAASQGFTEWLRMQMAAEPSCSFGLSLLRPGASASAAVEVEQRPASTAQQGQAAAPAAAAEQEQPASPQPPPPSPASRCARCARLQGTAAPAAPAVAGEIAAVPPAGEVVPLDAVLLAWQEHDAARQELSQTQQQLAEAERERDSLRRQLDAALARLQSLGGGAAAPVALAAM